MQEFNVGHEIRKLSHVIKRAICSVPPKDNMYKIKPFHMEVIMFIADTTLPVYQKDVEKEFDLRKTTVSLGLDSMEKEGLIKRISSDNDARLKQIVLTDQSIQLYKKVSVAMEKFEVALMKGITQEEQDCLQLCFIKIRDNALHLLEENKR